MRHVFVGDIFPVLHDPPATPPPAGCLHLGERRRLPLTRRSTSRNHANVKPPVALVVCMQAKGVSKRRRRGGDWRQNVEIVQMWQQASSVSCLLNRGRGKPHHGIVRDSRHCWLDLYRAFQNIRRPHIHHARLSGIPSRERVVLLGALDIVVELDALQHHLLKGEEVFDVVHVFDAQVLPLGRPAPKQRHAATAVS